jgi:class 3 adenylate cyclase
MKWSGIKPFNFFAQLRNSFLAVIVLIQILLITLSVLFGRMTIDMLEISQSESLKIVIQNVQAAINAGTEVSKVAVLTTQKHTQLLDAFAKRQRDRVLDLGMPILEDLKAMGFKQLQFHIPEGSTYITFLRVHNPEKFGDDLAYRPMIQKSNMIKEIISGLEQGKSGYGFRVVSPLLYQHRHIGSFEMGFDFGEPFLQQLSRDFPGSWAIYNLSRGVQSVDDRYLLATLGKDRDGDFQNLPLRDDVMKKMMDGETFAERHQGSNTGTLYIPVKNYRGDISIVLKYVFHTEYFNRIKQIIWTASGICLIGLALSGLVIFILNQLISIPVRKLVDETEKIRNFQLDDELNFSSSLKEINELIDSTKRMKIGLQSFRKYVPAQLVRQLIDSKVGATVGGQRRHITVFFSDVADFTSISESLTPNELTQQLSEYLSIMTETIIKYQGTVDKYIGDCVMAFWGAPSEVNNHAELACKAALECQKRCAELNARWDREGKKTFATRIGINSGEIVVGNIGSPQRLSYTIIGDDVNLASRLEGLNKNYGTQCIISESTMSQLPNDFALRMMDFVVVKGRTKPVTIYELVAEKGDVRHIDLDFLSIYNECMNHYRERRWDAAIDGFEELLGKKPDDKATLLLRERCRQFKEAPPPQKWRGEVVYLDK